MASIKSSDLYVFGSALMRQGIPLLTGGGITALVAVWEHYKQRNVPWGVYSGILVVFFGIAVYRIWKEQRAEIARLKIRPYDEDQSDSLAKL